MSEEWGPWIEHDGKGCPCVGAFVHNHHDKKLSGPPGDVMAEFIGIAGSQGGGSWDWKNAGKLSRIIRYRIRKPRGLTILEGLLENLPDEVPA